MKWQLLQFFFFFIYIKIPKNLKTYWVNIISKIRNDFKKKLAKDIKIYLKKKKEKQRQHGSERYKKLSEDIQQKPFEHREKNYMK